MKTWVQNQTNEIKFVLLDANGIELSGLGDTFTVQISKPGNESFVAGAGTKNEIGDGWYRYVATAEESDTLGAVAVKVSGVGAIQQNLVYEIKVADLTAEAVWSASTRTLTSATGQTQGPVIAPPNPWYPP